MTAELISLFPYRGPTDSTEHWAVDGLTLFSSLMATGDVDLGASKPRPVKNPAVPEIEDDDPMPLLMGDVGDCLDHNPEDIEAGY